jgi:hypothetical protein
MAIPKGEQPAENEEQVASDPNGRRGLAFAFTKATAILHASPPHLGQHEREQQQEKNASAKRLTSGEARDQAEAENSFQAWYDKRSHLSERVSKQFGQGLGEGLAILELREGGGEKNDAKE